MRPRELALAAYRRIVRRATGYGLNRLGPIRRAHERILRRLRPECVEAFGKPLYLDPADSLNLSIHGRTDPAETALLTALLRPGDIALDLGAHIGYYTLLLARGVGDTGKVYAFEPHPENAALLKRTVAESGYSFITVEQKAVWSETRNLPLALDPRGTVDHRTIPSIPDRKTIHVQAVALDDYFPPGARVDFIKMDLQGAEGHALLGMKRLLAEQPRLALLTEFEPWGLDASGFGAQRYLETLLDLGFTLHDTRAPANPQAIESPAPLLDRYPPKKDLFTNLLCLKGEKRP